MRIIRTITIKKHISDNFTNLMARSRMQGLSGEKDKDQGGSAERMKVIRTLDIFSLTLSLPNKTFNISQAKMSF